MRILLGAFGDPGHAFPMLALGRRLAERGHVVCLQTWRKWEVDVEAAGMQFAAAPEYQVFPTRARPLKPYEAAVRATQETVPLVRAFAPDVCVSDILTLAPALAAELCWVPVATLVPHVFPHGAAGHPPYSIGARLPRTALGRSVWRSTDRIVRRGLERGRADYNDARARLGLPPRGELHPGMSRSLTVVATLPQLEYPRVWEPWQRLVGPLMWEPPGEQVAPPPGDGPVVLVAPSTAHDAEHALLRAALRGLASEPVRVIATWNGREPRRPIAVPDNAVLVPWLSYVKTMPACELVISHGGHGTLVRALTQGCATVVCPVAGDMFENAARVDWAGLGVRLPRRLLSPATLRLAVRRALADPAMRTRCEAVRVYSEQHVSALAAAREVESWAASSAPAAAIEATVRVERYDTSWPAAFEREAATLSTALDGLATRMDHVGSTAVPGLAAKPAVDIQVSIRPDIPLARLVAPLAALDYLHIPDPDMPDYPFFAKPTAGERTIHLHACHAGSHEEHRHLAVRDYLRAHPHEADAYAALKLDLAARHADHRAAYLEGKDAYVKQLEQRALAWAARRDSVR